MKRRARGAEFGLIRFSTFRCSYLQTSGKTSLKF